MSTTLESLPITARTVSPVRHIGGRFYWNDSSVEVDEDGPRVETAHYRTDENGQGVWVWQATGAEWVDQQGHVTKRDFAWRQLVGHAQTGFNCSPGTRRERILSWLGIEWDDLPAREAYARLPRIPADLLPKD